MKKIAILGSAVSSVGFAPFKDPDWEIWACSPANRNLPRVDVWFELHNLDVKYREGLSEWIEWLKKQPKVYLQQPHPEFTGGIMYPLKEMVAKHGRFWWTSQVAYMQALAIEQKPEVIGIYGVDMAANSEYNQQRLACQYFIIETIKAGIQLVVPPESDLLEPAPMYGYCESSRRWRKMYARKQELQGRIDVSNSVNGMFAGAGRDLSGLNQQALARGISQGEAQPLLNQYNQNVQNAVGAATGMYNAAGQTGSALTGNQAQGLNIAQMLPSLYSQGPMSVLAAQQMGRMLPLQNLGMLENLTVPIAGLGGQSQGQSHSQGQQSLPWWAPIQALGQTAATLFM